VARDAPRCYLADTNVLSNRGVTATDPHLREWLRRSAGRVRISVITIAEMRRGLILLETRVSTLADRAARSRQRSRLAGKRAWYDEVLARFGDRVEPIDVAVAEKWAEVSVRFPSLRDADKAIAATAIAKEFGVATENLGDFRHAGVPVVNPFDPTTWDADDPDDPLDALMR